MAQANTTPHRTHLVVFDCVAETAVACVAAVFKHVAQWSLRGNAGEHTRGAAVPLTDLGPVDVVPEPGTERKTNGQTGN